MKITLGVFFVSLLAASVSAQTSMTRQDSVTQKGGLNIVSTSEIAAVVVAGTNRERVTGRVSLNLTLPAGDGPKDMVRVRDLNIAFFGVSQKQIAGNAPVYEPMGLLGFAVSQGKLQTLRYDAQRSQIVGEIQMYADASFLNALATPTRDRRDDQLDTPTLPTTAAIRIDLEKPLDTMSDEVRTLPARFDIQVRIRGARIFYFDIPNFDVLMSESALLKLDISPLLIFEVARKLCVQPVRLVRFQMTGFPFPNFFFQFTGEGLAFGEPGARREWNKADVIFEIREWKTLFNSSFFVADSSEMDALRALVDDDDCIEVFFVRDFSPQDLFGGGVTFGSGTGSAKIISSDANARGGIDFTHLAHELGHVLGIRHPDAAATASAQPGSTGTLMCPSGFLRDNPMVNSQQNKDLVSNPLLVFAIKVRTAGPDCINSADCGACP